MDYHLPNVDNRGHLANYHLTRFCPLVPLPSHDKEIFGYNVAYSFDQIGSNLSKVDQTFNNYVDKMRGGGCQKNVCFCPRSGYKNCPRRGGGGQTMAKFFPRSC
jgi:hypothetical protein